MKKLMLLMSGLMIAALAFSPITYAGHGGGHGCSKGQCAMGGHSKCCKGGESSGCCKGGESTGCPLADKFFDKAHFFLDNWEEIGLSEDQVKTIKMMKMDVKKQMVKAKADMEIMMIDMKVKLMEPKVNVEGINAMIDQGSAAWSAGAKQTVQAYAKLKAVLSEDQMAKAKSIWMKKKH
jgi:hypothetical protein